MMGKTSQKTLNMFLGQPCRICIKENNFDIKGSETDVAEISYPTNTDVPRLPKNDTDL